MPAKNAGLLFPRFEDQRQPEVALTLYLHSLAWLCHKAMIVLHETAIEVTPEFVDFLNLGSAAVLLGKWPVGTIPELHDSVRDQVVPETDVIIEYLQPH